MIEKKDLQFDSIQSCVIPYRYINTTIEFLMITSIKKKKWIFPKGYIEYNLTAFESAKKEAYEEAGVIGENETSELGSFIIVKNDEKCLVKVFSMQVAEELNDFPEKNLRRKKWMKLNEVIEASDNVKIKQLVKNLFEQLTKNQ
ncbi:MAG: NUDIX hydrolase [Ignavibacterium sp.]|jgi:ADP-ribose pyrophosphatase YjhB (NUDIX family)|nr:NUDIX hydrolase [Ignavibacterium sp.]